MACSSKEDQELDAEAAKLFVPFFNPRDAAPFDLATTLFDDKPVAALFHALRHGSEDERWSAAVNLQHVHHGCPGHCMHSFWVGLYPDRESRRNALRLAESGRIGTRARAIVPALTGALDDPSARVRDAATGTLAAIGPEALSACPALRQRLEDSDSTVRLRAAHALYAIRFETEGPLRTLVDILRHDPEAQRRAGAAFTLSRMGADARPAIGALETASHDPDEAVKQRAQDALQFIR